VKKTICAIILLSVFTGTAFPEGGVVVNQSGSWLWGAGTAEQVSLSGTWSGQAVVATDSGNINLGLSIAIRYESDRIFATIRMSTPDGSARVSEATGSDLGNGTLNLDEATVTSGSGVFAQTSARGYTFQYTGETGQQPNRMTSAGGDFFAYRSFEAVLTRAAK